MAESVLFRIAGVDVDIDPAPPELARYRVERPGTAADRVEPTRHTGNSVPTYEGPWLLGEVERGVRCSGASQSYDLAVEAGGRFTIAGDRRRIRWRADGEVIDPSVRDQSLMGPALVLTLAAAGVFCLHASAVGGATGAVLLLGPSGVGKSTLARTLDDAGRTERRRLTDDVSPVAATPDGGFDLRPHFPQLKLSLSSQYPVGAPGCAPLRAIVAVAPGSELSLEPLPARVGMLELTSNTVAARLFGPADLRDHFEFCAEAAATLPIYRLRSPRGVVGLRAASARLRGLLSALQPVT